MPILHDSVARLLRVECSIRPGQLLPVLKIAETISVILVELLDRGVLDVVDHFMETFQLLRFQCSKCSCAISCGVVKNCGDDLGGTPLSVLMEDFSTSWTISPKNSKFCRVEWLIRSRASLNLWLFDAI